MDNKINICHISDLHFGVYENKSFKSLDESFSLTDSLIEFITTYFNEEEKPHFLIISGDLTSISDNTEYEDFLGFVDNFIRNGCFAKCHFDKYYPKDRTIIVPGNHDVVRRKGNGVFETDKLKRFKEYVAEKGFNTPFGNNNEYCFEIISEEEKEVNQKKLSKCSPIPCALYYYPEYNILFHTLVSCYPFRGFKPGVKELYEEFYNIYTKGGLDKKMFKKLEEYIAESIYNDYGHFPQLYRKRTTKMFKRFKEAKSISEEKYRNLLKLAVTHHHVINLAPPYKNTMYAPEMRRVLGRYGVITILHGHLHYALPNKGLPKEWEGESSFFSCGSVAGNCQNAVNQFNMIEVQNYEEIEKMTIKIVCYEVDPQGLFRKDNARELYPTINNFLESMKEVF